MAHQQGLMARAQGNLTAAIVWLRRAITIDPQASDVHNDLIAALLANNQIDQALAAVRQALQLWPNDLRFLSNLGFLYYSGGQHTAAADAYRAALRAHPEDAETYANLGMVLVDLGDIEEARVMLEEVLRRAPRHPDTLGMLAQVLRDRFPPVHQAAAEAVLADPSIPPFRRGMLAYGLALVHDARQEHAQVVEQIRQAHACFLEDSGRQRQAYNPAGHHAYIEQLMAVCTPAYFERVRGWGGASELPVFIVGMPRSGTTLAEQILASHPQVFGAGELHIASECYRLIPTMMGKFASSLALFSQLTPAAVGQLAHFYLGRLRPHHPTAARIIDKLPDNYQHLGMIATVLPRARIIHLRRDVRDVALSCWMTAFRHLLWPLREEHISSRIHEYVRLMEHWRRVLPVPMLEIDYEELVSDTEAVARRMVEWCGLSWDPACLAAHQTRRVVRTASRVQVREPVYRRSLGRWKQYEPFLGPFFASLADLVPQPSPPPASG
jgi:tetratricopeptide (TPR) repeat protein